MQRGRRRPAPAGREAEGRAAVRRRWPVALQIPQQPVVWSGEMRADAAVPLGPGWKASSSTAAGAARAAGAGLTVGNSDRWRGRQRAATLPRRRMRQPGVAAPLPAQERPSAELFPAGPASVERCARAVRGMLVAVWTATLATPREELLEAASTRGAWVVYLVLSRGEAVPRRRREPFLSLPERPRSDLCSASEEWSRQRRSSGPQRADPRRRLREARPRVEGEAFSSSARRSSQSAALPR